jgi:putative hemolysin
MPLPECDRLEPLLQQPFEGAGDMEKYWGKVDLLTVKDACNGLYLVGFAASERCVDRALRLRYEVFNEELGEGLHTSRHTGLDRDEFDSQMHHLVLVERATEQVIGTYRLQPALHGVRHAGLYSAREYDLSAIESIYPELVETGRACITKEHRNYNAVILMWKGISAYMTAYEQRYLFGCCSLTTLDPLDGWRAMKTLRSLDSLHPTLRLPPVPAFACGDQQMEFDPAIGLAKIPRLFMSYLRLGGKVISDPAIDREFGTVDFLILLDGRSVSFSQIMMR